MRIGIDVGGTHTDAVLLEGTQIVAAEKVPTTPDVTAGVVAALAAVSERAGPAIGDVDAVMIGTTHFTNAVVQRRHLTRVAAVRIGLPASASLPPFCDWPADLANVVRGAVFLVPGGHEFDGRPIVPFDRDAMAEVAAKVRDGGFDAIAVSAVFSPLNTDDEQEAAEILDSHCPDVPVTMSHRLGRIGLLERENVALMNAALAGLARSTVDALSQAVRDSGIDARVFLTQNDGTVMAAETAAQFPVFSFASGPTNSMRGAAFLSGLSDAIVADVGGTTTDIGFLRAGFPREANGVVNVGGVRTLFRMPDLISLGLGGGSLVREEPLSIGPDSVGYQLTERGLVFGGDTLTATDVAVAAGLADIGEAAEVDDLGSAFRDAALGQMREMVEDGVDRMKTQAGDLPLLTVGGGAFLVPDRVSGASEVIHLPDGAVANAVGAAIAQVSGEIDRIFQDLGRDHALAEAQQLAEKAAVAGGADPASLKVVDVEDLPISYLPGDALRVRIRVVGDIA